MDLTSKWYAIHSKPRQEDLAAMNLQRLKLEVLNPKMLHEKLVWGQRVSIVKPLFPGYLFARFDADRYLHVIQYARGVRQVVRFGAALLPVDEEIIQSIRKRIGPNGFVSPLVEAMTAGCLVSIQDGSFSGLTGVFQGEMSDRNRVVILLEIMQARARLVIERNVLKPVA